MKAKADPGGGKAASAFKSGKGKPEKDGKGKGKDKGKGKKGEGKGGNGEKTAPHCDYCDGTGHVAQNCLCNPDSPKYKAGFQRTSCHRKQDLNLQLLQSCQSQRPKDHLHLCLLQLDLLRLQPGRQPQRR